ncbi:MAG: hypothetical protein BWY06_02643 [Candidatus Latescibacteria bacterium ADurb.Bin168]|nr:MAG: hypothetical protein BWY06_02643 [Candidatus Latescibacteria bacterium ADurb.Bin168]
MCEVRKLAATHSLLGGADIPVCPRPGSSIQRCARLADVRATRRPGRSLPKRSFGANHGGARTPSMQGAGTVWHGRPARARTMRPSEIARAGCPCQGYSQHTRNPSADSRRYFARPARPSTSSGTARRLNPPPRRGQGPGRRVAAHPAEVGRCIETTAASLTSPSSPLQHARCSPRSRGHQSG